MQQETLETVETVELLTFDQFWLDYPKASARIEARILFDKLSEYDLLDLARLGPPLYHSWRFREKKHIMAPDRFLRRKRWHDTPDAEPGTTGGQRQASHQMMMMARDDDKPLVPTPAEQARINLANARAMIRGAVKGCRDHERAEA